MSDQRKYPDWYYEPTSPGKPDYAHIEKKVRSLVYLLRNKGWNTTQSCGHEFKGLIVIRPYGEQFGHEQEQGGPVGYLGSFLREHGHKHFEIKHTEFTWHGTIVDEVLVLKLLGPDYMERWQ